MENIKWDLNTKTRSTQGRLETIKSVPTATIKHLEAVASSAEPTPLLSCSPLGAGYIPDRCIRSVQGYNE
jgi:hypothetical protein